MNHAKLRRLLFLALCCSFGMLAKQLISPAANLLTDALHIPGGVSTSFSLMFLAIAASLTPGFGQAALMSAVQSLMALCMGRIGSMGLLSPIGYIVPGFAMDVVLLLTRRLPLTDQIVLANSAASACASLAANLIVFRLSGAPLLLYLSVAATSGALCGLLAGKLAPRIGRAIYLSKNKAPDDSSSDAP